ncbi:MAG: hypothetical protein ACYCVB_03545 [Bacilli bacterium]
MAEPVLCKAMVATEIVAIEKRFPLSTQQIEEYQFTATQSLGQIFQVGKSDNETEGYPILPLNAILVHPLKASTQYGLLARKGMPVIHWIGGIVIRECALRLLDAADINHELAPQLRHTLLNIEEQ